MALRTPPAPRVRYRQPCGRAGRIWELSRGGPGTWVAVAARAPSDGRSRGERSSARAFRTRPGPCPPAGQPRPAAASGGRTGCTTAAACFVRSVLSRRGSLAIRTSLARSLASQQGAMCCQVGMLLVPCACKLRCAALAGAVWACGGGQAPLTPGLNRRGRLCADSSRDAAGLCFGGAIAARRERCAWLQRPAKRPAASRPSVLCCCCCCCCCCAAAHATRPCTRPPPRPSHPQLCCCCCCCCCCCAAAARSLDASILRTDRLRAPLPLSPRVCRIFRLAAVGAKIIPRYYDHRSLTHVRFALRHQTIPSSFSPIAPDVRRRCTTAAGW
jgi:hypothetical protein